jgi:hypothetical protein
LASSRLCSIDGCGKHAVGRGWCHKHWNRWRTTGDPLGVKKTPPGEAFTFLCEVVLSYTSDECLIWPYKRNSAGYGGIGVEREMQSVNRIVCEHANGPPPTPDHQAAHSCGRGHDGCCSQKHLRWATPAENAHDRIADGTEMYGEKNPVAKLTEADVQSIRRLRGQKSQRAIAAMFNVSQPCVFKIQTGISWGHLGPKGS